MPPHSPNLPCSCITDAFQIMVRKNNCRLLHRSCGLLETPVFWFTQPLPWPISSCCPISHLLIPGFRDPVLVALPAVTHATAVQASVAFT